MNSLRKPPTALPLPDGRALTLDRPRLMGILNVTPDSFSDGGKFTTPQAALAQAQRLLRQGADLIDVGGESTRPGSEPVSADEQIRRTVPVIAALRAELPGVIVSIDTSSAAVAEAALRAGASILNDVTAGGDGSMFALAARSGAPIVLMHMRGTPRTMQQNPVYADVVEEVRAFLLDRAAAAERAGIGQDRLVIDPGIGFGKTKEHNLTLLSALDRFVDSGYPVLLGTSRKRFMGALCPGENGQPPPPHSLVGATCATTALAVAAGVQLLRVHDVLENRQAADVAYAIRSAR